MWTALKSPDDGHLFLQGLYLAAWVGWLLFFLSVFLEIVAQVQHRAALRLPGLGWMQRGVGTMVTAAVVIVASPVAAMADAPTDLHGAAGGVVATQTVVSGADGYEVTHAEPAQEAAVDNPVYTVRPGDSLWRIAQEQLGDPNRFADIAKLNDGRVMPGGTVFHYDEFLQSGWVLIMPPDTGPEQAGPAEITQAQIHTATAAPALPAPSGTKTYTVRQGDSLSSIARNLLGDSRRWDELFELNKGRPQAGAPPIWRADLIWPGDVLILPDDAVTGSAPAPAQAPSAPPVNYRHRPPLTSGDAVASGPTGQAPEDDANTDRARAGNRIAPGPAQSLSPAQAPNPNPAQTQPGGGQNPAQSQNTDPAQSPANQSPAIDPDTPETVTLSTTHTDSGKTVAAIGGLLAAGLLSALGARRLRRVMQRRPGERIAMRPPGGWELEMSSIENPTGRVFIDAALRTLSMKLAEVDRILPDITAAVLKPHGLEVHLARTEPPVSPFYADPQRPGVWVCPLGAPLAEEARWRAVQAPYPALVSLGFDEGDDSVLVDLEATRGISLLAPVHESVSVLRAMAVELATGTWADQVRVTLVGFGQELPPLFAPGCLHHTESLPRAVEAVARWSATVAAVLDKRDVSLREARTYPDAELAQVAKTHIVLSAVPLDPRSAYQLRQLLSGRQRTSMAIVAVVQEPDHLLSPWVVTGPKFHTPQAQPGDTGIRVRMQALRDEQYAAIVRDLSGADLDDEWASAQQDGAFGGGPSQPQLPAAPQRLALPHRNPAAIGTGIGIDAHTGADIGSGPVAGANGGAPAPEPLRARALSTPEPAQSTRFRIPVEDLFRVDGLPPAADARAELPGPGTAKHARHALNPANLPQFDVVVAPWHGGANTETITAVPHAAQARPLQPRALGLTMLAGAGALAAGAGVEPGDEPPPRPEDRLEGLEPELEHLDTSRKPGGWQSAYWNQRRAAEADKQSFDPSAMARSIDILGPVELAGTAATAGSRAADLAEVAAFIMLHPGCSAAQIAAELWPGRKGAATIRDAQVSRLREWLGTDAYGEQHLRVTPHGYALGPSVSCDWLEFVRRVQAGELVNALTLVRGRPFEDAPLRRYGWAEALRHEMTALVIDTAHYVAEACLREQNPRGAQNAAYRGLQAAPESELLYRDLLTALAALGDLSGARQHADTLIAYADREGIDLQPETTALLRDVLQAVPGV
ncbi:MAG: LysM peptidoglycan-binding domain-containing protein [Catenulispora sp.]